MMKRILHPRSAIYCGLWKGNMQKDCECRPVCVMELSATQRSGGDNNDTIRLNSEDEKDKIVVERIDAIKQLRLHGCDKKQRSLQEIADLGLLSQRFSG